jgi:hypothetical protein
LSSDGVRIAFFLSWHQDYVNTVLLEAGQDVYLDTQELTMSKKTKTIQGIQEVATRIAPAVALLMLGDTAFAGVPDRGDDVTVPEPSTIGLLAAGVAVGGVVAYIRNKRRK